MPKKGQKNNILKINILQNKKIIICSNIWNFSIRRNRHSAIAWPPISSLNMYKTRWRSSIAPAGLVDSVFFQFGHYISQYKSHGIRQGDKFGK